MRSLRGLDIQTPSAAGRWVFESEQASKLQKNVFGKKCNSPVLFQGLFVGEGFICKKR